jgi:hypothetical protein
MPGLISGNALFEQRLALCQGRNPKAHIPSNYFVNSSLRREYGPKVIFQKILAGTGVAIIFVLCGDRCRRRGQMSGVNAG